MPADAERHGGERMPVLFVGHGSPLNAIEENAFSRGFRSLAGLLPRPRAILAVSAHWYVEGTFVTGEERPRTIHDFSGFPEALYAISYPARGSRELAERALALIGPGRASARSDWGLDHGTWSVLKWIYPEADVPVVQLSLDARLAPPQHFELARGLRALRGEGVLILGSGNITHDLRGAFQRLRTGDASTPADGLRFDATVARCLAARDFQGLLDLWPGTEDGRRQHPTPDHWLPLVYCAAVAEAGDAVEFPITGFDHGLSMRSALFGGRRLG